jgi:hypothetical protein
LNYAELFFPQQSRCFIGEHWVNILLRTLHLIGVAGVGAAFLFSVSETQWRPYMLLTIISGCAMIFVEVWSNGIWLIQLRGLSTLLKLLILSMTFVVGLQAYILISVIVTAGLISHAPGKVRYFSFIKKTG